MKRKNKDRRPRQEATADTSAFSNQLSMLMSGARTGVIRLEIQHDEWCRLLAGNGECNCEPDAQMVLS
jgi:hypothetical protein